MMEFTQLGSTFQLKSRQQQQQQQPIKQVLYQPVSQQTYSSHRCVPHRQL